MAEINERAVIKLVLDDAESYSKFVQLQGTVDDLNGRLKTMRENGQQGTEMYKDLQKELLETKGAQTELIKSLDLSTASVKEMQSAMNYWQGIYKRAEKGSDEFIIAARKIEEIKPALNAAQAELRQLGNVVEEQAAPDGVWGRLKTTALGVFTGQALFEGVKYAGRAILDLGREIFETTAKFEKYDVILTNALGSQEAAAKAMGDIKKMAAETPFSVDELTSSYMKYVNRGLKPSMDEMKKLGDIAASQGKSFEQLTEAVLDAGTGEFERLKEFGIAAKKNGNEVELSFKGIHKTVGNTPEAIQGALVAFGEMDGVQGTMAAMSATLDGRISNLGDTFDNIKVTLGTALMPVFEFFLETIKDGLNLIQSLVDGTTKTSESGSFLASVMEGLQKVFKTLWDVLKNVWDVVVDVMGSFKKMLDSQTELTMGTNALTFAMAVLRLGLNLVGTVLIAALSSVGALVDGFNILINKGKEVANFFGADFKIDPKANFDNLQKNASENFGRIKNLWTDTAAHAGSKTKEIEDTTTASNGKVTKAHGEGQEAQTAKHAAEGKKRADQAKKEAEDIRKANEDLTKKIDDIYVKSIADDTARKIAKAALDYEREVQNVEKMKGSEAKKNEYLKLLATQHNVEIKKINDDATSKSEKDKQDAAAREKKRQDDELKDTQKMLDEKTKAERAALENEYKAVVASGNAELAFLKTLGVSTADEKRKQADDELRIKKRLADEELKNKKANLKAQSDAEKAKLNEQIAANTLTYNRLRALGDTATVAERARMANLAASNKALQDNIVAVDTLAAAKVRQLNTETAALIIKLETDTANTKKKLTDEELKDRKAKTDRFYDGVATAMSGDLNKTIDFLKKKTVEDGKHLNSRMESFAQHAQGIANALQAGLNFLIDINKKATENKLRNLDNQLAANVAAKDKELAKNTEILDKDYANEVAKIKAEILDDEAQKIALEAAKERHNAKKVELQTTHGTDIKLLDEKHAAEALALKKDSFEKDKKMRLASAIIAGSLAVLSAMAMPWPIGLAMAVVAGVKAAVDITKIKRETFQAEKGFTNAGIIEGGRHGASYGKGGVALIDRESGEEVGEAEGGEPFMILSRNTMANNGNVIRRLLHSSLHRNGAPITLENGGVVPLKQADAYIAQGLMQKRGKVLPMWEDGGTGGGDVDTGGNNYASGSNEANAAIAEQKLNQEKQLSLMKEMVDNTDRVANNTREIISINTTIANKNFGISLHDLQSAESRIISANRQANL